MYSIQICIVETQILCIDEIRNFRRDVLFSQNQQITNISNWASFYSTSECRDLCFHVQEHRFTIEQLKQIIEVNQLQFLGFLLPQSVKSLFNNYFPEDTKLTKLENWSIFEERHPHTFRQMYQFWICKTI